MTKSYLVNKIRKFSLRPGGGKVLIIIDKERCLENVFAVLKDASAGHAEDYCIISFDAELPRYFYTLNIEIYHSWDYLSDEDCLSVDGFFFNKLRKEWPQNGGIDAAGIKGIDRELLGRISEFDFISANFTLIKYTHVLLNAFSRHSPAKIIIFEDGRLFSRIAAILAGCFTFDALWVWPGLVSPLDLFRRIIRSAKDILGDLCIKSLDFFVLQYVFLSGKFNRKILIDHRLYEKIVPEPLKGQFLICAFEKGLRFRLEAIRKGIFYLPLRMPSCSDVYSMSAGGLSLRLKWAKLKLDPSVAAFFKYRGISFWMGLQNYIFNAVFFTFPRIKGNLERLKKFFTLKDALLVVMRNDGKELERTAIEAALGTIPSVVVQHGIYGDIYTGTTLYSDVTAVWGEAAVKWFGQFGYTRNLFTITGNLAYDRLYPRTSKDRNHAKSQICHRLNLDCAKKTICYLTQSRFLFSTAFWRGNKVDVILKGILGSMTDMWQDTQLIIKVHPHDEKEDSYERIVADLAGKAKVVIVKDVDVFDVLEVSDLVIMVDRSSSGLEALILDKPLIAVELHRRLIEVPFIEEGVAVGVKRVEDIAGAIKGCLYDEEMREGLKLNRKKFISDYVYKIDGKATQRVLGLVTALAEKSFSANAREGLPAEDELNRVTA